VDSGDQGILDKRIAGRIAADDPVSERIFDVNKDTFIDSGDQGLMAKNTCILRGDQLGCPVCPLE
jgi:hypothetical protein